MENWATADGDLGIVARNGRGENVGAAWIRLGLGDGAVTSGDRLTPELAIGTLPDYRGRGIGSTMLRALIASARMRFDRIALSVRESNPAIMLYRRLGFVETGRITNRVGTMSLTMALDLHEPSALPADGSDFPNPGP